MARTVIMRCTCRMVCLPVCDVTCDEMMRRWRHGCGCSDNSSASARVRCDSDCNRHTELDRIEDWVERGGGRNGSSRGAPGGIYYRFGTGGLALLSARWTVLSVIRHRDVTNALNTSLSLVEICERHALLSAVERRKRIIADIMPCCTKGLVTCCV